MGTAVPVAASAAESEEATSSAAWTRRARGCHTDFMFSWPMANWSASDGHANAEPASSPSSPPSTSSDTDSRAAAMDATHGPCIRPSLHSASTRRFENRDGDYGVLDGVAVRKIEPPLPAFLNSPQAEGRVAHEGGDAGDQHQAAQQVSAGGVLGVQAEHGRQGVHHQQALQQRQEAVLPTPTRRASGGRTLILAHYFQFHSHFESEAWA